MQFPLRSTLYASLFALTIVQSAAPARAFQDDCPVVNLDVVSAALGQPVTIDPDFVSSLGGRDECLFGNDAGIVLVGREIGFFGSAGPEAFADENIRRLSRTGIDLMFTPDYGLGDAASWVEAADPVIREERLSILVVRRGPDAFFFGVDESAFPSSRDLTRALAAAVLLASP